MDVMRSFSVFMLTWFTTILADRVQIDLRWCEDFLFNLSFIRHAERFTAIQIPIYYYMKRKGSLVSTDWKKANAVKLKFQLLKTYKELYQSMDRSARALAHRKIYRSKSGA